MQGTIIKVNVVEGEEVNEGDQIVVMEAMKMEQPIAAHRHGIIRNLNATVGSAVSSGEIMCEIVDE
ncbi:biotin carboxylase of acetyl-CoA carboxylase [Cutibacterium acnes JCM 18918]|nr:biotin carboxylase of acetyl-CoA carboxylase [Cutibacterium acnes JCM 18918]